MRVVVQRVSAASVDVINELGTLDPTFEPQQIGPGFMILVGVTDEDGDQQIAWLTHKILNLRVFEDEQGKMNRSIQDIGGEILSISQFTLFADVHKGNQPPELGVHGISQGTHDGREDGAADQAHEHQAGNLVLALRAVFSYQSPVFGHGSRRETGSGECWNVIVPA